MVGATGDTAMMTAIELLFTLEDERVFSGILKAHFPKVIFVDGFTWPTPEAPLKKSLDECETVYCSIWNRDIYETMKPPRPRPGGGFSGPTVPTIQFLRGRFTDNILRAGRMAAGVFDNDPGELPMLSFIKAVWKLAKKFAKYRADFVDPVTREITTPRAYNTIVGPDATAWGLADGNRFFKNDAGNFFLRPSAEVKPVKPPKVRRK